MSIKMTGIFLGLYLAMILILTLSPGGPEGTYFYRYPHRQVITRKLWHSEVHLFDLAMNVLLYVPLGIGMAVLLSRVPRVWQILGILFGALISGPIEVFQIQIGRYTDLTDIYANAGGYVLGYVGMMAVMAFRDPLKTFDKP